jgi:type IV pilus assembly protein PilW
MKRPDVNPSHTPMRRASGFTIVELMVGMLIGLLAIVVMFQIFAVSEGQRRTTTGAGDAQQNGVTSLYLMERDARMAGYGTSYFRLLGCSVTGFWNPSTKPITFNLAPATITNGAGGTPDSVTFVYSGTDSVAFSSSLAIPTAATAGGFVRIKDDRFPYKAGDLFVVGEVPAPAPASQTLKPCSMFQVTSLPCVSGCPVVGAGNQINFAGNNYLDENLVTHAANYVPPTALVSTQVAPNNVYYAAWTPRTSSGGRIENLGNTPTVVKYSIVNNQLVATNLLLPDDPPLVISDGIVQFQAQCGLSNHDTSGTADSCVLLSTTLAPCTVSPSAASVTTLSLAAGGADQWGDALPPGPWLASDWRRIVAVRFALVARSATQEKVDPVSGNCTATTIMPVWPANGVTIDLSADPNWKCYRYRVFSAIVPFRNFYWFPDPLGTGEGT